MTCYGPLPELPGYDAWKTSPPEYDEPEYDEDGNEIEPDYCPTCGDTHPCKCDRGDAEYHRLRDEGLI